MTSHGTKRRYYTPAEVATHNKGKDCWVSIFGRVFELTDIIAKNRGPLTEPIVDVRPPLRHFAATPHVPPYCAS